MTCSCVISMRISFIVLHSAHFLRAGTQVDFSLEHEGSLNVEVRRVYSAVSAHALSLSSLEICSRVR